MAEQKVEPMEVKKLDMPSKFAAIKSGLKTTSGLANHEIERHNVWYEYFKARNQLVGPSKTNILWVGKHWKKILAYIYDVYSKKEPSTLRNHLEGLANILLAIDKNKFKEDTRQMFNTGLKTQQAIDKATQNSMMKPRELKNYVSYRRLVATRNHYETLWRAHPKNLSLNMRHLILALNTYYPPLRLEWLDMRISPPRIVDGRSVKPPTGPTPEPPSGGDVNYLWESTPGEWSIVINHDKIENKRVVKGFSRQIFPLKNEIPGITDGKKLNSIINDSLRYAPRNYVLVGVKDKHEPLAGSSFGSAMRSMFNPKKPLQNLLRKAYINYTHRMKIDGMDLPEVTLREIANRMRHTLEVARAVYRVINVKEEDDDIPIVMPGNKPQKPKSLPIVKPRAPTSLPPRIMTRKAAKEAKEAADAAAAGIAASADIAPVQEYEEDDRKVPSSPIFEPMAASVPPPPIAASMPPPVVKPYFNPAEYQAKYRAEHKEAIMAQRTAYFKANRHAILRAKILGNLNNGVVKKPTKASIIKYGLVQRPDNGLWETTQAPNYKP